jgi:hypothetical protein
MPYLIDLEKQNICNLKADHAQVMENGGLWAVMKYKNLSQVFEGEGSYNQLPKRKTTAPNGFSYKEILIKVKYQV